MWEVSVFPSAPTDGHVHVLCVRALVQNMHRQMDVQMCLYLGSKKSALERDKKIKNSVKSIYSAIAASVQQTVNLQGLQSKRWLGRYRHGFTFRALCQRRGGSESLSKQDREAEGGTSFTTSLTRAWRGSLKVWNKPGVWGEVKKKSSSSSSRPQIIIYHWL